MVRVFDVCVCVCVCACVSTYYVYLYMGQVPEIKLMYVCMYVLGGLGGTTDSASD